MMGKGEELEEGEIVDEYPTPAIDQLRSMVKINPVVDTLSTGSLMPPKQSTSANSSAITNRAISMKDNKIIQNALVIAPSLDDRGMRTFQDWKGTVDHQVLLECRNQWTF